jgi:protein SCO1/2
MRRSVAVAALAVAAVACGGDDRELVGFTRDPAPSVATVTLPDVSRDGEPFTFRPAEGGLLIVYFGYTNCPDVCPKTMADLGAAIDRLDEEDAARVDVAMVTVDPERDTAVLADYVQSFVDGAHALATDDPAALRAAAAPFAVGYEVVTRPDGEVEVGHTDLLFAVDDTGTLVLNWPFGTSVDDLAADIRQLLDR